MALFQLHLRESPAEPENFLLGQVRVACIRMLRSKPACKIDQRIVPEGLVKNRSAAGPQHTKQMRIGFGILDHVVQNAEADHQIEEVIRIRQPSGVHFEEFGGEPISPRRLIRSLDSGLRQVESPDLRAVPAQIESEIAITAAIVEHAQAAHISDGIDGFSSRVTPPAPSSVRKAGDLPLHKDIQEIVQRFRVCRCGVGIVVRVMPFAFSVPNTVDTSIAPSHGHHLNSILPDLAGGLLTGVALRRFAPMVRLTASYPTSIAPGMSIMRSRAMASPK